MNYEAAKYTCGSCRYYEYEGEDKKGYCSWYKAYYYPYDSCDHWEEGNVASSGGGCFLTTACCEYKGLPDDCRELTAMRRVRDEYLKNQPYGEELIRTYYGEAPAIVDAINSSPDRDTILSETYDTVRTIADLAESGKNDMAVIRYLMMFHRLSKLVR